MSAVAATILIIDDELPIRKFLRVVLSAQNYRIIEAPNAKTGLDMLARETPDLIILDIGLPDIDGVEVVRRIRTYSRIPILILSARGDERAKVEAFEQGADDYLTKPFGSDELVARVRTAQRHSFYEKGEDPVFESGDLKVDLVRRHVYVNGREVRLSPTEFSLLRLFVTHAGKVLTHQQMFREVWGGFKDMQYLRVYVRQLRQKLEADPEMPRHIVTEPGVGYRLQIAGEAKAA
jgi:two-component system, OmpR family, KDP operon response regulator KdpE